MRQPLGPCGGAIFAWSLRATLLTAVTALVACAGAGSSVPTVASSATRTAQSGQVLPASGQVLPASGQVLPGSGQVLPACVNPSGNACHGLKIGSLAANPDPNAWTIYGYTPLDLHNAYNLGALPAAGTAVAPQAPTIAIVAPFDSPNAESDLAIYRARFGLPACTTANGCFKRHPLYFPSAAPAGWADETALDLAMASAACPTCRIALVEAASNDVDLLGQAVEYAASLAPAAISGSYGMHETDYLATGHSFSQKDPYAQRGIPVVVSAGDDGVTQYPASSPNVIAVAGTSLRANPASPRGWAETPWSSSSTGCSIGEKQPSWQASYTTCSTRAIADVAFDADPYTGVAVYSSAAGGWIVMGGTSVGAPFVAGLYAAQNDFRNGNNGAGVVYSRASQLNPLPASFQALGTPNGAGAF